LRPYIELTTAAAASLLMALWNDPNITAKAKSTPTQVVVVLDKIASIESHQFAYYRINRRMVAVYMLG